jgi:hypothetical protein
MIMKHLMMLLVCAALLVSSVGCCWTHGHQGYGGYGGGCNPCPGGACGPYGYSPGIYQGAYLDGTTTTAGLAPYTMAQPYPTMATINPLPTY